MTNEVKTYDLCYPKSELNPNGDPLPIQELFHNSQAKYRFLVGGWGTGKTTSICIEAIKDISIPNNEILCGRKYVNEFEKTTLKELMKFIPPEMIVSHDKQAQVMKFFNGTELNYVGLDASREAFNKIASMNLGACLIDQGEEIDESIFIAIQGRLRRQNARRCFYGAFNPEGHNWQWRVTHQTPIPNMQVWESISTDNIYLPPDYVSELLLLPDKIKKRYVYCSYEDFAGLVFSEFLEVNNIEDGYEPKSNDYHLHILDYGYRNPTCILLTAIDYDGILHVYDEIYKPEVLIKDIADEYKTKPFTNEARKIADPSINKVERDGENVKMEYIRNGIYWQEADNDVRQGINRVNQYLKDGKIKISRKCVNLLREIGEYKWKELKPGTIKNEFEEPVKHNDHAADCLRYAINEIFIPFEKKVEIKTERQQAYELSKQPEDSWASY